MFVNWTNGWTKSKYLAALMDGENADAISLDSG
jgi:hypothetical protein